MTMKSVIIRIVTLVAAIGIAIALLMVSVLLAVLVSVGVLWAIDALCGTAFYNWQNVGILSIVLLVASRMRSSGKTE